MINIKQATIEDKELIIELARNIYVEYYLHLWHEGGAAWYMETKAYSEIGIELELKDANVAYYIATENNQNLGYMKLVLNAAFAGLEALQALEIERIYVYKKYAGKGLGKNLMQVALQRAQELKKGVVFLKAMDSSTAAIGFYKKLGFEVCGKTTLPLPDFFRMKKAYRGMLILKKNVER